LGTGRLGHRVAPAKGLVEVGRAGSVVGASMSSRSSSRPVSCRRIHRRTSERSSTERTRRPRTSSRRSCPARCTSPTRTRDTTS
jgi:hypothetical protein